MIYKIKLNKEEKITLANYYGELITKLKKCKAEIEYDLKHFNYFREHRTYKSLKNEIKHINKEIKFIRRIARPLL